MKRILLSVSLVIMILLAACSLPATRQQTVVPASTSTLSPDQVQTQINQMLTMMPTNTGQPAAEVTPTLSLPTVPVDTPAGVQTATTEPTLEAVAPTNTSAPQAEATATALPTVGVTPLSPTATQQPPTGPTFTPAPGDPRSRLGAPTSTDNMDDPSTWVWPTGSDKYTTGAFGGGYQTVTALTGTDGWRMANPTGEPFTNLYLEATIRTTSCSGSDHYGLIFRVPVVTEPDQGYLFGFTCDGRYSLRRWNSKVGTKGEMKWLVNWTASSAIAAGANQTNRLGVMMSGSRLLVYANGKLLTEVKDSTFASGNFGVFIGADATDRLNVQVDSMSYWVNPQP